MTWLKIVCNGAGAATLCILPNSDLLNSSCPFFSLAKFISLDYTPRLTSSNPNLSDYCLYFYYLYHYGI
ncbi:unnamed protein product [Schistosoma curassoni]|uniref:Secreted protein n=1 Tax=Schistosoma curassoni TaxID=6186 RepID=A0A183K2M0_9TREM|nr:unnamed protein product [Schistosoma curassoni]